VTGKSASPEGAQHGRGSLRLESVSGDAARRSSLVIEPDAAAGLIEDQATVVVGGSGSLLQVPETLLGATGKRFEQTGGPSDLTVVHVMGLGDQAGRGVDHLAQEGMVSRFVGSHFVLSPRQQGLIAAAKVEAIGLPAGTITLLYREIAGRRPGLFTDIGLETYVDPRQEWGRMNTATAEGISRVVVVDGKEWLFYPRFDVDVALLRGSEADEDGNISMEEEAGFSDNLAIAQAAHNSGGIVLVEVKRVVPRGSIPAGRVRVPGALVDHIVVTDYPNQTPITVFEPARTGADVHHPVEVSPMPLDHRKVVARRAAMELRDGQLVNLGVGMANGISYVALEEGFLDRLTLTVEQGLFGGLPGIGLDSGTALNPAAIIDMPSQFDLYDGGALDAAGLAFAQIDASGNVNVTRVGETPIGPGGFIDISQKARCVIFCGTFRGGDLDLSVVPSPSGEGGELRINREGRYSKFVETVDSVTFSSQRALRDGQRVVYVTERAVFTLGAHGLELVEIAPGVDLERDVLALLPFRPVMRGTPTLMDARIFAERPMDLFLRPARGTDSSDGARMEEVSLR
jgi:propionate CoA-transferase